MDKYTVDLDQVLNDFEYSELTTAEEHVTPAQPSPAHHYLQQQQHHPQRAYSSTKHSINNVFSSLNDYLSAEITDNSVEARKIVDGKQTQTVHSTSAATATGSSRDVNHLAGGTPVKEVPLESLIAQPISLKIENHVATQLDSPEIILNDLEVMKELQRSFTEVLSITEEIKNVQGSMDEVEDSEPDGLEEKLSHEEPAGGVSEETYEEYSNEEANIIKEDINHVDADIVTKEDILTTENAKLSCDTIGFHVEVGDEEAAQYLADLDDEEDESFYDMPSPTDVVLESIEKHETVKASTLATTIEATVLETKVSGNHLEVTITPHGEVKPENQELTTNYEVIPTTNTQEVALETLEVRNENLKVINTNGVISAQSQQDNNKTSEVQKEILDRENCENQEIKQHCDGFKRSEIELQHSEILSPSVDNMVKQSEVEVKLSTSDGFEVRTSEQTSSIEKLEKEEQTLSTPKYEKEKVMKLEEFSEVGTSSKEVPSIQVEVVVVDKTEAGLNPETPRPSSLDIKEKVVNIIGNPGSTPYNNIYVSKEVPASETSENLHGGEPDTESTASSRSPTFSEASTDSVHSLDSPAHQPHSQHPSKSGVVQDEEGNNLTSAMLNNAAASVDNDNEFRENVEEDVMMAAPSQPSEEEVYVDLDSINQEATPETQEVQVEGIAHVNEDASWLGKRAPIWIPDADAVCCQHCELRFTVLKRRHHCRACGLVLCAKCCSMRLRLEYLGVEARVCSRCYDALQRETDSGSGDSQHSTPLRDADATGASANNGDHPNPNNPMEYCSVVPPHQQVQAGSSAPSVMVPVGVLKRKGSSKKHNKSVMFCDGIRPGSDLTSLDQEFQQHEPTIARKPSSSSAASKVKPKINKNLPLIDPVTQSFIPENENCLPPTVTSYKSDITYTECGNNANVVEMLQNETLTFAVQRNLHIHVRLIRMDCCVNKSAWCFSTEGLIAVGQDEIVILLEYIDGEAQVPKDVFHHLNNIYNSAVKGTTVTELGLSIHPTTNFLDSRNHAGFIFVRPSFQCLQHVIVPKEPYLVGVLVHRWETPWARIFPLRLVLRLGAEYRYYPVPLISTRHRDSVFVEIGHTIINLLADFRNFSYTLPNIRGLTIHMEEKSTTVAIPVNRYDQVMKSMSNSSEHILAFGGNFSAEADSHLVCIQDTQGSNENSYKTHAINIQNKPRKVTGASFIVFNGALKSSSGLTAKSSIVEDGLMIQIPPEHMVQVRESLRNMKNHVIQCGCVNAASDETVNIVWCSADVNFNVGVKSSVDGQSLSGVPSIRVHNGKDYTCNSGTRLVRWTEVFLLQNGEENARTQDPVDISKVAESISKATCQALVKYLDLLATNSFMKIGIRTTLHVDDVSYSAGSNGQKLPPIYMKSLDNELVPVLHRITSSGNVGDGTIVLELIFRILNV